MTGRISRAALAVVLTALTAQMALASDRDVRIHLAGSGGEGAVRFRDRGSERRLRVEIENLSVPKNSILNVTVDGKVVGTMKVTGQRSARLELRSRGIQVVPVIAAGATLAVVGPDGDVLMKGKF